MNKRIDFSQNGGLHIYQDTLDFMQQSYSGNISAIANAFGSRVIVSGVLDNGASYGAGWVVIDGELLPFAASSKTAYIVIEEAVANESFEEGASRPVYFTRQTKCGVSGGYAISDFVRMDPLAVITNNVKQARTDLDKLSNVTNRLDTVEKMLKPLLGYTDTSGNTVYGSWLFWGRPASEIPEGWEPVPDADWKGRVPVVLDESQTEFNQIGKTGGTNTHVLTVAEMPSHNHDRNPNAVAEHNMQYQSVGGSWSLSTGSFHGVNATKTGMTGNNQAHNNLQPYKVVMFIRFKG